MSSGHFFIIDGDLSKLACDAVLVPTDAGFNVESKWDSLVQGKTLPTDWDSRLALPLKRTKNEPWVWLGNMGQVGHKSAFEVFEPALQEFVAEAAVRLQAVHDVERIYASPKYRLAVNLVGSGLGGASMSKGEVVRGLVETLSRLASDHDVDIVLVTWGAKPYAAAQRARHQIVDRRRLFEAWAFDETANPALLDEAQRLAKAAISSELVLFIGAGVSVGAGLPTWAGLLRALAEEVGIEEDLLERLAKKDPRDQATIIERRWPSIASSFRSRMTDKLTAWPRYALQHGLLASLPSKEAVTTNFDELFEAAVTTAGRGLAVLPQNPRTAGGHWLLKLHGTVDNPDRTVLTRADYIEMPRQYGALMGLVQGMLLMRHMMFVGYSLSDEDFHELVHEVRSARGDAGSNSEYGTVLTLFDDPLERELWANDLHVVPMITSAKGDEVDSQQIANAARQLEIFLDLLGFLSTTSAAFFLDESYERLSDDEAKLRTTLRALAKDTRDAREGSVAYLVKRFLNGLGA